MEVTTMARCALFAGVLLAAPIAVLQAQAGRARALGIVTGTLPPGPLNAITDVSGVLVGQTTIVIGDSVRTGVTAIRPTPENLFLERVPAAIHVGNGFGKLLGVTQVTELGELETPILLTCTLCVWRAADAMVTWMLEQPGMERVRSINPVVGETNDGYVLNAIRSRLVSEADVRHALTTAASGPVAEGSVGAGTGTIAFEWKGGIGTASRLVKVGDSTWTMGVLVQTNFGGASELTIIGVPVGRALGKSGLSSRAMIGIGRTGSSIDNGSGDYVIAFSTSKAVRRARGAARISQTDVGNDFISGLFDGVAEATEEAIYNSLFMATT
jgi:D-aminopeptidase